MRVNSSFKRFAATALLFATTFFGASGANAVEREVHVALSFPNGVVWPYFSVATEMGFAREEGISFSLTSTDGSAASYKALATRQVDFAMTQPAQILNGLCTLGENITSVRYTAYQGTRPYIEFATLAKNFSLITRLPTSGAKKSAYRRWREASTLICAQRSKTQALIRKKTCKLRKWAGAVPRRSRSRTAALPLTRLRLST